jgi:hypothetical protein
MHRYSDCTTQGTLIQLSAHSPFVCKPLVMHRYSDCTTQGTLIQLSAHSPFVCKPLVMHRYSDCTTQGTVDACMVVSKCHWVEGVCTDRYAFHPDLVLDIIIVLSIRVHQCVNHTTNRLQTANVVVNSVSDHVSCRARLTL